MFEFALDVGELGLFVDGLRLHSPVALEAKSFSLVPSPHATLDDVLRLHAEIMHSVAADPGIRGIVVTHGTDTLELHATSVWEFEIQALDGRRVDKALARTVTPV